MSNRCKTPHKCQRFTDNKQDLRTKLFPGGGVVPHCMKFVSFRDVNEARAPKSMYDHAKTVVEQRVKLVNTQISLGNGIHCILFMNI